MKVNDFSTMSADDLTKVVNENFNRFNIDSTYSDFADVCWALAANCELALKYVPECLADEIEQKNVAYLRDILKTASQMFLDCDDYFRNLQ
jgi:hypothetical protein